jgi:Tol biopolymer transport system component
MLSRRALLMGAMPLAAAAAAKRAILFTGRGNSGFLNQDRRLELVNEDGSGLRVLELQDEAGSGFGCYGFFRDGRALLQSLSLPAGWRGKTFDDYYPRSRTRIWACDLETGRLEELCHRNRLSSFYSPCCLLPGESRIAVTAMLDGKSVLMTMNLDGSEPREITGRNEFVYGVSLSPEGRRLAFHSNYRIHVCGLDGTGVKELAAKPGTLFFGSSWSPDGEWVLFQLCDSKADPAHDWSAIGIARADGSEPFRALTPAASAWFGASYGARSNPGGGSNQPQWAPDGSGILFVRRIPDSVTPWFFQTGRRDTDHFNREFVPGGARGGTHLVLIDPRTGAERSVTPPTPGVWDFRGQWRPDSRRVCFLCARVGQAPELWVTDVAGTGKSRRLTNGVRRAGAEHPAWVPVPA